MRMMADNDIWWRSLQPFLQDEDANVYPDPVRRERQRVVAEGTAKAYEFAQRFNIKTAWGTDVLFNPQKASTQGRQLAKLTRFYPRARGREHGDKDEWRTVGAVGSPAIHIPVKLAG